MNPLRWYPDELEPVRFDAEAAAAAVRACRAAIEDLVSTQRLRRKEAVRAREEWRGPHREAFDAHLIMIEREAAALVNALRDLIAAIERAELAAIEENHLRARARNAYDEHVRPIVDVHAS